MTYSEEITITYRIASETARQRTESRYAAVALYDSEDFVVSEGDFGIVIDGREYGPNQIDSLRNLLDVLQPRTDVEEGLGEQPTPTVPVVTGGDWGEMITYKDGEITVDEFGTEANIIFASIEDAIPFPEQALAAARAGL